MSSTSVQLWSRLASKTKRQRSARVKVWTFDRPVENDELLTQQEVLRDQLGFAATEVSDGAKRKAVDARLGHA